MAFKVREIEFKIMSLSVTEAFESFVTASEHSWWQSGTRNAAAYVSFAPQSGLERVTIGGDLYKETNSYQA